MPYGTVVPLISGSHYYHSYARVCLLTGISCTNAVDRDPLLFSTDWIRLQNRLWRSSPSIAILKNCWIHPVTTHYPALFTTQLQWPGFFQSRVHRPAVFQYFGTSGRVISLDSNWRKICECVNVFDEWIFFTDSSDEERRDPTYVPSIGGTPQKDRESEIMESGLLWVAYSTEQSHFTGSHKLDSMSGMHITTLCHQQCTRGGFLEGAEGDLPLVRPGTTLGSLWELWMLQTSWVNLQNRDTVSNQFETTCTRMFWYFCRDRECNLFRWSDHTTQILWCRHISEAGVPGMWMASNLDK